MIAIGNGLTNQTGIAVVQYRLPAPDPNATEITFGIWNITASLNLSQSTLTNATSFTFNYLSNIESIKMPASINIGQTLPIELTVDNGLFSAPSSELDITVFDQANVPIGSFTYINTSANAKLHSYRHHHFHPSIRVPRRSLSMYVPVDCKRHCPSPRNHCPLPNFYRKTNNTIGF